jgi:acyl carrier protein
MDPASDDIKKPPLSQEISKKVKEILAEQIGTEPDEINDSDSFIDHLHMRPSDISDFYNLLTQNKIDVANIDIEDVVTVGDLIEMLSAEESL